MDVTRPRPPRTVARSAGDGKPISILSLTPSLTLRVNVLRLRFGLVVRFGIAVSFVHQVACPRSPSAPQQDFWRPFARADGALVE